MCETTAAGMAVPWNYTLNVNLQEGAVQQLEFLQEVASHAILEDEKVLRQALYRYENFWLPLAAKHPAETLAAPLDVEWIWHCHMLSPLNYQHDCSQLAGRIISHKLYSAVERRKHQQKARSLWQVEYPQEPYQLDLEAAFCGTDQDAYSRLSCDIVAAAFRQKVFYYQVSLPHYRDDQFLSTAELRYKRFLFLKQQNPDMAIVPCYDIDLMWHTHQLHPLAYKIDTETILGWTLVHDDAVIDRSPGFKLSKVDAGTVDVWQSTFEHNFAVCGALYRGEPPTAKLHAMTPQQNFMASTKTATFTIEKVEIQGLPTLEGKLVLKMYAGYDGRVGKCIATFRGEPPWSSKELPEAAFETSSVNFLKIRALDQAGMLGCFGNQDVVGERDVDLRPTLDSLTHETSVEHSVTLTQDHKILTVQITTHFCWPQRGHVHLFLRPATFSQAIMPQNAQNLWGPVPLRELPTGADKFCQVACHSLVNHSESVVMTCRVVHSQPLLQSAVQVFYQEKMASVAHLVGLEQLPLPTQVSDPRRVPYLNPKAGERAVLIKNHTGDWALVVGRWTTYRKTASRIGSRRGRDIHPGQLMVRVRLLADYGWREMALTYQDQQWSFTLGDLHADLKNGFVHISDPDCQDVAEKVALALSVSLLHVLCVPRPAGWKRGLPLRPQASKRGTRTTRWIPSEDMPFIVAAGMLQDTPTNGYIRRTFGNALGAAVEGENLLGLTVTDSTVCRPEDGIGGVWAHPSTGCNETQNEPAHALAIKTDQEESYHGNGNTAERSNDQDASPHGNSGSPDRNEQQDRSVRASETSAGCINDRDVSSHGNGASSVSLKKNLTDETTT